MTEELLIERTRQYMKKASTDPRYFGEKFLKSVDPVTSTLVPFKANFPQKKMLASRKKSTWIACHRRAGKSFAMTLIALWHAVTQKNKKIIVFAPATTQINVFFEVIDQWIRTNPMLEAAVDRTGKNHSQPNQRRTFISGSYIEGYITGINASIEGSRRGLTADVVIVDEAQELSDEDWKVIDPIIQGDQYRQDSIRAYITGTINKPVGRFYDRIKRGSSNAEEEVIFVPILENEDYDNEQIQRLRMTVEPFAWSTEWMLEVGEADTAVFKKDDVEFASQLDWLYDGLYEEADHLARFIGVDWDKTQAGTNIAVIEYNKLDYSMRTLWREEVDHKEFTYMTACNKVLEVYNHFRPEMVITDQGNGEFQWEYLYLESEKRGMDLHTRLVKMPFNTKLEVPNVSTGEMEKKMFKPTMVGMLALKFQEHKIMFPFSDEKLKNQFLSYHEVLRTANTVKYSSTNEHIIDCHLLALYGIWWLYENLLEQRTGDRVFMSTVQPAKPSFEDSRVIESFWGNLQGLRSETFGGVVIRSNFGSGIPTRRGF